MIRRVVFTVGVAAVLTFILVNGYFAAQNVRSIRHNVGLTQETAVKQADISAVLLNLVNLETGQRGYLLTEDQAYLQPYTTAIEQLAQQFSSLRTKLADRPAGERTHESQLEGVSQAMIAEADETIRLRQQGYRSRAFRMVNSNRGKELMDQARAHSASLLEAEASRLSAYEQSTKASLGKAFAATILWSSGLLLLTAFVFGLLWLFALGMEREVARGSHALREKSSQLETFTQTVSHDLPELLGNLQGSLEDFINQFGDYLPARGQEHVAQIRDMAARSNGLMMKSLRGQVASNAA